MVRTAWRNKGLTACLATFIMVACLDITGGGVWWHWKVSYNSGFRRENGQDLLVPERKNERRRSPRLFDKVYLSSTG